MNNPKTYRFISFGCWNNGQCTPVSEINSNRMELNGVTKTMNVLHNFILNTKNMMNLFVLGDNYYPNKIKEKNKEKKKIMNVEHLMSGVECINQIPILNSKKYILLGNHDLDNDAFDSNFHCNILKIQSEFFKQHKMNFFSFGKRFQSKIIGNNTLIILLDTTMYETMSDVEMMKYLECYNIFENNTTTETLFTNISQLQHKQKHIVQTIISDLPADKNIKNIITMSHHPILGIKYKEEADVMKFDTYPLFVDLLCDEIYKKMQHCHFYHISADVHQYQKSFIQIKNNDGVVVNVQQYVVGTGGADKDAEIPVSKWVGKRVLDDYKVDYTITDSLCVNGFLDCKINYFSTRLDKDDDVLFDFINTETYVFKTPLASPHSSKRHFTKAKSMKKYHRHLSNIRFSKKYKMSKKKLASASTKKSSKHI